MPADARDACDEPLPPPAQAKTKQLKLQAGTSSRKLRGVAHNKPPEGRTSAPTSTRALVRTSDQGLRAETPPPPSPRAFPSRNKNKMATASHVATSEVSMAGAADGDAAECSRLLRGVFAALVREGAAGVLLRDLCSLLLSAGFIHSARFPAGQGADMNVCLSETEMRCGGTSGTSRANPHSYQSRQSQSEAPRVGAKDAGRVLDGGVWTYSSVICKVSTVACIDSLTSESCPSPYEYMVSGLSSMFRLPYQVLC